MKARLSDDGENSATWYALFPMQDSSFLLYKNFIRKAHRLSKTKLLLDKMP